MNNYLNEKIEDAYKTILVYVEDRYNGGGWAQELTIIKDSIAETLKAYKKDLGPGYWINYQGPGQRKQTDITKKSGIPDELSIFDDLDEDMLNEKIVKLGNKWQVQSEKGRNMGTYDTKTEAEKRLQQVHYFKYKNEDLKDDAKKIFGTTNNWKLGLYINTDGTILDGSGKAFGSDGYARSVDHREISDLWDSISGDDAMIAYMNEGNIRWKPESPGFELIKEPTEAQYNTLENLIPYFRDTYYVDISNTFGENIWSKEYESFDSPILDIKSYFRLNEEYIDSNNLIYATSSPYQVKQLISNNNFYFIAYDRLLKTYFVGKAKDRDVTHINMLITASKQGYYEKEFNYATAQDYIIKNIDCFRAGPTTMQMLLGGEGYFDSYLYNFAIIAYRDMSIYGGKKTNFYDTELGSIFGKALEHRHTDITWGNTIGTVVLESLLEDTRTALINKSRNAGDYKDKTHGKNRFERKKFSKVANAVKEYNQLDMNDFFKRDILTVKVPVQGETDSYTISIKMEGVLAEIAKNVKSNKNKFEFRTVIQALTKIFNIGNVYVNCTCPDYLYNFDHWNIINNVSTSDTAHDPGPGKNIRNPKDDKGRGCKHVLLVLNNGDWMMKVASVINNYVHYAEEHMQKPFLKLIFPKIYGIPADEMVEQDLIDDDKFLDSSKGLIDAINAYGAKRGQYKPGTNKNPVTGTGGRAKKEEEKPAEEKEEIK